MERQTLKQTTFVDVDLTVIERKNPILQPIETKFKFDPHLENAYFSYLVVLTICFDRSHFCFKRHLFGSNSYRAVNLSLDLCRKNQTCFKDSGHLHRQQVLKSVIFRYCLSCRIFIAERGLAS